jgi:hypothetical protein
MKESSLIHVKFEYLEAVESKKDLLFTEINLLKTASSIKRYSLLRDNELKIKNRLSGKIKELKLNILKLQHSLPQIKISLEDKKEDEKKEFEVNKKYVKDDLEIELEEIQKKLAELEERN